MDELSKQVPVNMRMFIRHLVGSKEPLTEKQLAASDLNALRIATQPQITAGKTSGIIGYGDYNPEGRFSTVTSSSFIDLVDDSFNDPTTRMETTIGMAKWHLDKEGNVIIEDTYRFDASRQAVEAALEKHGSSIGVLMDALKSAGPLGMLNALGNIFGNTEDEEGIKVRINLGKPK